jgi:plasmid maintenance system antidote protein VapI
MSSRLKTPPCDSIADACEERDVDLAATIERIFVKAGRRPTADAINRFRTGALRISGPMASAISEIVGHTPEFWLARDAQYAASLTDKPKRPRGRPVTTGPRKPTGRPRGRPVTVGPRKPTGRPRGRPEVKGPRVRVPRVPRVARTINISLRVTPELSAAIAAAADLSGCTPTEAIRRALFDAFTPNKSNT